MKLKLKFILAVFFSSHVYASVSIPINKQIVVEQTGAYKYELPLNIYATSEQITNLDRLVEDLNYAQKKYDKCQIRLQVNEVFEVKETNWLNQWESFWFSFSHELTNWEKHFFKNNKSESVNILLVESLNWTVAGQGTWGIGYAQFLRDEINSASEKTFFDNHMIGNVVIGNYRAKSTLAHEIGHAGLNLKHTYDSRNLMSSLKSFDPIEFDNGVAQISTDLDFSEAQCAEGIKDNPFLRPILLDFNSVSDEIGSGAVVVNDKNIENDSCVLRLLYENDQYRIEYDYMGAVDIAGLDRFDLGGAILTSKNKMERDLNLKPESPLAQKICSSGAFVGKKTLELKDKKTSEIRIEGLCAEKKTEKKEVITFTCKVD